MSVSREDVEEDKLALLSAGGRLVHHLQCIPKVEMIVDGEGVGGMGIGGDVLGGHQGVGVHSLLW